MSDRCADQGEREILDAIEQMRERWTHAPLARADIEERIALRLVDREVAPEVLVHSTPPACRLFVYACPRRPSGRRPRPRRASREYVSAYVHGVDEVDGVLDRLFERALERAMELHPAGLAGSGG